MKIFFAESPYDIPPDFIRQYEVQVRRAHDEVMKLLPFGSDRINFFVQPREFDLMDETDDHARVHNSNFIELAFNPTLDSKGMERILRDLRPSVYHELNHAARYNVPIWHKSFLDDCILEGLANVFAREYADEKAPWADYPDDVELWISEIKDAGSTINYEHYLYNHPDGRRWIGYKVGTYIVDTAMSKSGKSILELSSMECSEIFDLAEIDPLSEGSQ